MFGDGIFKELIMFKMRLLGRPQSNLTSIFLKKSLSHPQKDTRGAGRQ